MDGFDVIFGTIALAMITSWIALRHTDDEPFGLIYTSVAWIAAATITYLMLR
jgi:hypothetical protein